MTEYKRVENYKYFNSDPNLNKHMVYIYNIFWMLNKNFVFPGFGLVLIDYDLWQAPTW